MTRRLPYLLVSCLLIAALLLPSAGLSAPPGAVDEAPVTVDISSLITFLERLPADEKEEQLRDWAAYGLASSHSSSATDIPIRHPSLRDTAPPEVSPGRVVRLSSTEWGVIVPKGLVGNRLLIGGLIDKQHAETNRLPNRISLYSYTHDVVGATVTVSFERHIETNELFGPEYCYRSARVNSVSELEGFLRQVDDLVSVRWGGNGLILGGRKYAGDSRRGLTVEEVAALYQAYNEPRDAVTRSGYEARIRKKYEAMLAADGSLREAVRSGKVKKSQVLARLRRESPFRGGGDPNVGFSLDTDYDYAAIADEMERLVQRPFIYSHGTSAVSAESIRLHGMEITAAAKRIRGHRDIRPLLALRRRFFASESRSDRIVNGMLQQIELDSSYSTARYDGKLQGTRAAMVLFYTDLLAKLWALDYNGMASRVDVKGFRTMPHISMPKLHWEEYRHLSKTRLWFGLRQEGFEVYGGSKALFQPVSTRVYAASSDPLFPGKESLPNYQSKEFLGWWDRHYEAMADYEPEYHKLNQIQKWSAVFMLLKESRSKGAAFLRDFPVARDLDFEAWNRDRAGQKTRISVPFLDKSRYGRTTECLRVLNSTPFQLMGTVSMLSGGVSLASRKDILAKLHRHPVTDTLSPYGARGTRARGNKAETPAVAGAAPKASPGRATAQPLPQPARAEGASRRNASAPSPARDAEAVTVREDSGGRKSRPVVKLTWEKSPQIAMIDFVTALAERQESHPSSRGEELVTGAPEVSSVVRVEEGKAYLVKTAATGERWIYLSVNPARVAEYPARASGAFPEADIFCAKEVSAAQARKLSAGRPVVR